MSKDDAPIVLGKLRFAPEYSPVTYYDVVDCARFVFDITDGPCQIRMLTLAEPLTPEISTEC